MTPTRNLFDRLIEWVVVSFGIICNQLMSVVIKRYPEVGDFSKKMYESSEVPAAVFRQIVSLITLRDIMLAEPSKVSINAPR